MKPNTPKKAMHKRIDNQDYCLTDQHIPTRRAVMWLGQTCNLKCYFCYFNAKIENKDHPEHPFMSLEKAKKICHKFVTRYQLNSIDIQGGEPTIYPYIFQLLDYCNSINIKPTLISNLAPLAKAGLAEKYKEHGVYDFLVSLQGIGNVYDQIVGRNGSFNRQMQALENLSNEEIPIRINTVLTSEAIPSLDKITKLAITHKARVVNFLGYNNTGDQGTIRADKKIPDLVTICKELEGLIDDMESKGIEVNVRFLPFCLFKRKHYKNIQNLKQKIYDKHEWEVSSRFWIDRSAQRQASHKVGLSPFLPYTVFINSCRQNGIKKTLKMKTLSLKYGIEASFKSILPYQRNILKSLRFYTPYHEDEQYFSGKFSKIELFYFEVLNYMSKINKTHISACDRCDLRYICDGVYKDYLAKHGEKNFKPIDAGGIVTDPRYFMNEQLKVVEKEEYDWAFK